MAQNKVASIFSLQILIQLILSNFIWLYKFFLGKELSINCYLLKILSLEKEESCQRPKKEEKTSGFACFWDCRRLRVQREIVSQVLQTRKTGDLQYRRPFTLCQFPEQLCCCRYILFELRRVLDQLR